MRNQEDRLDALLEQWEELTEKGSSVTPEELCQREGVPELLHEFQRHLAALNTLNARFPIVVQPPYGTATLSMEGPNAPPSPLHSPRFPLQENLIATIKIQNMEYHKAGGLGVVCRAEDGTFDRPVAVKFLHEHLGQNPKVRERFLRETRATARLEHPGVVPVHGMGQSEDGRPFYVMQFIHGHTLEEAIKQYHADRQANRQDHHLAFRDLLMRFISVCKTIAYAHSRGVLHRDIKPSNIMLGRYGETIVIDWGLALPIHPEQANGHPEAPALEHRGDGKLSAWAGTPAYMSPEQATGKPLGPASDVYALGSTLYHLLTGKPTLHGGSGDFHETIQRILEGQFPRPRDVNRHIPRSLQAICLKAQAVEPDKRYPDALALANDVERFLADEQVTAYEESSVEGAARFLRRHRGIACTLACALLVLVSISVGVALWMARAAEQQRQAHELALQRTARVVAQTVRVEIEHRWDVLTIAAGDPQLHQALREANAREKERPAELRRKGLGENSRLQRWLQRITKRYQTITRAESWFLCGADGTQLARSPYSRDTVGHRFAYRDYFHGKGHNLPQECVQKTPVHITRPYLSSVYRSRHNQDLKVAFSVPVYGSDERKDRQFLGILGLSVKLGEFSILKRMVGPHQMVALIDLRPNQLGKTDKGDQSTPAALRGVLLYHPDLASIHDQLKEGAIEQPTIPTALVEQLLALDTPGNDTDPVEGASGILVRGYHDPMKGPDQHTSLAAFELVPPPKGSSRRMNWAVVVQERAGRRKTR